jgi:hypothetical protein
MRHPFVTLASACGIRGKRTGGLACHALALGIATRISFFA